MTVRYTTIDGEIVAENRGGVRRTYVPDPLGSTVALLDSNQQKTDTFDYWPYGEERSRTGATPTPFQFGGTLGYYRDGPARLYVRARSLTVAAPGWLSAEALPEDPVGMSVYAESGANPVSFVDPAGADRIAAGARPAISPCTKRANEYCDYARKTGRRTERCACRVATSICKLWVDNPNMDPAVRLRMQCVHRCLVGRWRNRNKPGSTPRWRSVDAKCAQCGVESQQCCSAWITAEQDGYTRCEKEQCGRIGRLPLPHADPNLPFIFPFAGDEEQRRAAGIRLCCKGALGNPL